MQPVPAARSFPASASAEEARKRPFDEYGLAVENVHLGIGHLAMDEQGHADPLHRLQRRPDIGDVGHAQGAVGGGVGRIELARREIAFLEAARIDGEQLSKLVAGARRERRRKRA